MDIHSQQKKQNSEHTRPNSIAVPARFPNNPFKGFNPHS
jgi:hypothetical protein